MQYIAIQCSSVQCSAVQCSAVQYNSVQRSAVQCIEVLCSGLWLSEERVGSGQVESPRAGGSCIISQKRTGTALIATHYTLNTAHYTLNTALIATH